MAVGPVSQPSDEPAPILDGGFRIVLAGALVVAVLLAVSAIRSLTAPAGSAAPSTAAYLYPEPRPAPPLALTDQDGRPFTLAGLRGSPVLVFFGYTHCPDVCPTTIGDLEQVEAALPAVRAVFVTVDPARDTQAWLREYLGYLRGSFTALTGSEAAIRAAADAWGVKYARVDTGTPGAYAMSHTADVFLVDPAGVLRAHFPFGSGSDVIAAGVRQVLAATESGATGNPPASAPPVSAPPVSAPPASAPPGGLASPSAAPASPGASPAQPDELSATVVSSSVWAGGSSPVIVRLATPAGSLDDPAAAVSVGLETTADQPVGPPVAAVAVRPPGETSVFYVATLDVPTPGWWRLLVSASLDGRPVSATTDVAVLDPGGTAALGAPAPGVHTPTLADVGGDARAVTTDPAPDLRLSQTSTTDALAAHRPFLLVVDSTRFRVTSACGKALVMARYLVDRWPGVAFIHLEPYRYSVVTDTPVLDGTLDDPPLAAAATAWGVGSEPWGARSMPWVFVVDGAGIVRAKYQGVMGSYDVDVILSLIAAGG